MLRPDYGSVVSSVRYSNLGDVVSESDFPDVDLALRRGKHIDREDTVHYALLSDGQKYLEPFYSRYGCELIHSPDGYFYLLPNGERLPRRMLSVQEMLVGQALALLYLDPATLESGGFVTKDELLAHLSGVMGSEALVAALYQSKKRVDERVAHEAVRSKVFDAIRRLASMGFVDGPIEDRIKLRSSLMRFAEPVRGTESPREALLALVARGEVVLDSDALGDEQLSDDGTTENEASWSEDVEKQKVEALLLSGALSPEALSSEALSSEEFFSDEEDESESEESEDEEDEIESEESEDEEDELESEDEDDESLLLYDEFSSDEEG